MKLILDVGNCGPDHASLKAMIQGTFDARVISAQSAHETIALLDREDIDLVLVNRKLDRDYSDGLDIIKRIKSDATHGDTPVMMITNFEEHQTLAIAAGAERGFGKLQVHSPETQQLLAAFLTTAPESVKEAN